MVVRTALILPLLSLLSLGCMQPQRAFEFRTAPGPEPAIDTVLRVFASHGLSPALVDDSAGLVQTEWENTGFLFGQIQNTDAVIVRRYSVTVWPGAEGERVTLRADVKRCSPEWCLMGLDGCPACEALDGLVEEHQAELDALGIELREALGGE